MAPAALALALLAALGAALPGPGLYLGMFAGMLALAAGLVTYRSRGLRATQRLVGAAASTLGALALILCTARFVMVIAALGRLDSLIG